MGILYHSRIKKQAPCTIPYLSLPSRASLPYLPYLHLSAAYSPIIFITAPVEGTADAGVTTGADVAAADVAVKEVS